MSERKFPSELLDYSGWPVVDVHLLPECEAIRYTRLFAAIKASCDGVRANEIKHRFGVSRSLLHYYMKKCTSQHEDGRPFGWRALVPSSGRRPYVREADLQTSSDGRGLAGAFASLLRDYPKVGKWLDARLRPDDGTRFQAAGLDISLIHQDFLSKLRQSGRRPDQYPFTTKRHGYEALAAYVRKRIAQGDDGAARSKYGDQATARPGRNLLITGLFRPLVSYERTGYDEYQLPDIETVTVEVQADHVFELPVSRGWLCIQVDFKSAAILAWTYSIAGRFRSLELLQTFEHAIRPPPRSSHPAFRELTPLPDEGLPAAVVSGASGRRICSLIVDNHLAHLANPVVVDLRHRTGVSISFGKVHSWIERFVVEGIFGQLQRVLRRLASTTGSGPHDPIVRNPVEKAVRYKIRAGDIHALLDTLVARHNARRRRSLMMATPNEVVTADWAESARLQIVPRYPPGFVDDPCIAIEQEWPVIRGSRERHRTPYVQLDEVEYTNDLLRQSWNMIGEHLCVHIRGDYRTVRAFRMDGVDFGVLHVSGVWAVSAHTREVRKEINKLYREGVFKERSDDPVAMYQRHLAAIAIRKVGGRRKFKITSEAGKLARTLTVPGGPSDPPDYRYVLSPPTPKQMENVKPRGRRAFFAPPRR